VSYDLVNYKDIIRVPYTTLPNFEKYQGPLFNAAPCPAHMRAKNNMFEDDEIYGQSWFETPISIDNNLPNRAAEILGLNRKSEAEFGHAVSSVKDIALLCQDDIAILHQGRLEACCFMFPSGWAPEEKAGFSFAELHQPVADSERLRASADIITKLMSGEHSYHRSVWGLASSDKLSMHPRYSHKYVEPKSIDDIWFRYEHQITAPIERDVSSLFTVDVQLIAYGDLSESQRARIMESINSMSENVRAYKNIAPFKKILERS
jgi:hypothetical protein